MYPTKHNNNLVLVQSKTTVDDGYSKVVSWVEHARVWVSITPNRGKEFIKDSEKQSLVSHTIRGDYLELESIDETMRFVYNTTHTYDTVPDASIVFDILAVMPDYDGKKDVMIQAQENNLKYGDIHENDPK